MRSLWRAAAAALAFAAAGCATLPDADAIIERHAGQQARFESARGELSPQRSAAILARLKSQSGDIDVLDKQIALEQSISGSPLVLGNKVTLLEDGAATYPAMFAAIRNARDHINLETYIFEDDEVGRQFADLLLEQQARGVQVNVIYDSFGGLGTPKAFFDRLTAGGIAVLEFNPVNPLAAKAPWSPNNRDHRKLLVVDGKVAFIGGLNISNVYTSGSASRRSGDPEGHRIAWRDTHMQIDGPVVAELQKLFMSTWEKQRGKPLAAKNYFPELQPQGRDIVRAIGSTPDDPFSLIYLTLMSAIGNAEAQVYLTNAYFVPDPQLIKALTDAAGRGVDVKLILPGQSDSEVVFHAGRSFYSELLAGGIKLYEHIGALLHAKTAVVDGVWSTVGSTNLDWRSFLDNDEVNAVVIGRDFGTRMQAMFARPRCLRAHRPGGMGEPAAVAAAQGMDGARVGAAALSAVPGPAEQRLNQVAQLAAVVFVVVGCYLVLHPFVPAILFAAVVCSATWPLYLRLRAALWGRPTLAALAMSLVLVVLVIGPSVLLAVYLANHAEEALESGKALMKGGPIAPPAWLGNVPVVGELLAEYWQRVATGRDSLATQWQGLLEPARKLLLGMGRAVGEGLMQLMVASFIGFFFYRDGEALMLAVRRVLDKLAGGLGATLLETVGHTSTGVVHGIFGTALAQGLVALAGFMIAGMPAAMLLAAATMFLSILPIGPPLVWGGATLWLAFEGHTGRAIFMALWGLLAISTIDNLVKPYLISRSSDLPLLLIVLGVFGGVVAFGFIGLFIGPPVLAIGLVLTQLWISHRSLAADAHQQEDA